MTENELELIHAIRQSDDPVKATVTAIQIIHDYLNAMYALSELED